MAIDTQTDTALCRVDQVMQIIRKLDELPADHEPTTSDLWDAIVAIEVICED